MLRIVTFVPDEVKKTRLSICETCEFRKVLSKKNWDLVLVDTPACKKCGCILNWKTSFKREQCPIGKWGKWENDSSS